ncbi:E3 ubiquitin-protein ligase TRIM7-like isoform 2-T2 [Acanthopagrus schlegelii]
MSCQSFLPVSVTGVEAEGLASPPWSVDSPERCEEHGESLSLFCLDDLEPLCKQCAAVSHGGHRVYLLTEAATDCKEELRTSLNGLKKKMVHFETVSQTCEHVSRHNQTEARLAEEHMRREFESLHQFLREEEKARLLALRVQWEEKKRGAEETMDRMNQVIKSLEEKIQLTEEELDAGGDGVEYLQRYQGTMNSTWTDGMEPQRVCSPLIDVAKHLAPVTLDPRTAGRSLSVSSELNMVHINRGASEDVAVPANPERFHPYSCILAREGFDSGVHCWDIEVGETNNWTVGVAAQSVSRRTAFEACPEAGLCCISLRDGEYQALTTPTQAINLDNPRHLSRVHVKLDWDAGTLEFIDADTEAHLFTFRHNFTEKMYPYFESVASCGGLAVLARRVNVTVGSDCIADITEEDQTIKSESCAEGDINTVPTSSKSGMSEPRHLTENKNSTICSVRAEKATKHQGRATKDQLIKTKPNGNQKTKDNRPAAKKQSSKPKFSVNYHISLNRALN